MVCDACAIKRGMWCAFGMNDVWEHGRGGVQMHVCEWCIYVSIRTL